MNRPLLLCLLTALVLRLAFVIVGFPVLAERWQLREDGDGYGSIARTIREGGYTDIVRGPVYPVVVAAAGSPVAVKLLQAVLDSMTCLLVYRLAGQRLWAAWLYALYPFAIWRVAFVNKEIVLAFLLTGYALAQVRARSAMAGAWLGLVNLCKPSLLLWPVVLLIRWPRRTWLTVLTTVAVVAPWTIRNGVVTGGEFLPVATEQGGVTTFIGNYQPTLGLWEGPGKREWLAAVRAIEEEQAGRSAVQLDRVFYRAAWEQVRNNPVKAAELAARKCFRFWFRSAARREQWASAVIQSGYLVLLGVGLWRRWPWDWETGVLVGLIGYVMVIHALSYADLRFSLPVMPLVCALAACGDTQRAHPHMGKPPRGSSD